MDTDSNSNPDPDPREQELLSPTRPHPDNLILPAVHPTRFPGTWVAIFEESIPADQRHRLWIEGYRLSRIQLFGNQRAQVTISEEPRPDRDGETVHPPTQARYEQFDPTAYNPD